MSPANGPTRLRLSPHRALPVAVLALVLLALVARDRDGASANVVPAEGGVLRAAAVGRPSRVHPLDGQASPAERDLASLVYAGLTRPGPDGAPLPALAEGWRVSDDARVFIFRLRNGLRWQDGVDLTVTDVLFTLDVLQALGDGANPRLRDVWARASVSRLGVDELRVELPQPFAPLPAFASFGLLPAHRFRGLTPAEVSASAALQTPVGAGPFRLTSLTADGATLGRFESYALGAPYLNGIDLRFVERADDARRLLASGQIDSAVLPASATLDGPFARRTLALSSYTMVVLNNRDPLLADSRVRRALAFAVDRARLVEGAGGRPLDVPLPSGWWSGERAPPAASDLAAAEALLTEAGWRRDADGVQRRDGRDLLVTLAVGEEVSRQETARQLAEQWGRLGARTVVRPSTTADLLTNVLAPRAYQAALIGWDPGPDPDPFSGWHSSLAGQPAGNLGDVNDPALDDLLSRARATAPLAARRTLYDQVAARFSETAPAIILFDEQLALFLPAALGGAAGRVASEPADRWADVHRWFLLTRRA